jgi:hypothetical protein
MRYAHRTFLWSIIPFAILLIGTFWAVQQSVMSTVREGLRTSLRRNQEAVAKMHKRAQIQNSRSLRIVAESSALKAGLQLLMADQASRDARLTVEDQLREICEITGVDLLLVSSVEGRPLIGVRRNGNTLASMDTGQVHEPIQDFFLEDGYAYRITSIPINQAEDNIAILSVGEHFDLSDFSAPVVLVGNDSVLKSSLAGHSLTEIESGLKQCRGISECEVKLGNEVYLSLIVDTVQFGNTYSLRSMQNLDEAINPVQHVLRQTFLKVGIGALLAAILISALSARSIVRPLGHLVWQLRQSGRSGLLPEVNTGRSAVKEIRELTTGFNDAAVAIRQGREELNLAYIEFIGSLANALDARDPYTAGHSFRVSEYSCAIAESLRLPAGEIEQIRIGAMLHDIGKIGISDNVLQKPGRLTDEEFALIKEHPVIGRKILEGVHGLAAYLPTVELHHENWDGTGYPFGLSEEKVPLAARIVHVADAYDAMTSDRPYRRGMSSDEAVRALQKNAGTQFDPLLVSIFVQCVANGEALCAGDSTADSLRKLAVAIQSERDQTVRQVVVGEKS